MGRGDRELERLLRRVDAEVEYAIAPPVDQRVRAICGEARNWIIPNLENPRRRYGPQARVWLDQARRRRDAIWGDLSVRERDILNGCLGGVESAIARWQRRGLRPAGGGLTALRVGLGPRRRALPRR